ncbi:MAG: hypothetical protein JOZ13_13670 [Alphaproteobacteria bacterium]|nr:hypothetical protein [Alphaproteobacteria bacterium]
MAKLSAGQAIRFAYGFTLSQLGTIIGLIWAPMLAIAVLNFLPYLLGDNRVSADQNAAAAGQAALRGLFFGFAALLLTACVYVAVMRQALGQRTGPAVFYFSIGSAELRVFAGVVLLSLFLGAIGLGTSLAGALAIAGGGAAGGGIAALVLLGGACLMLVLLTRLGFLLVPVATVENRIGFERGWQLTAGNFWRILSVIFVVTLPAAAILLGALAWLIGPELAKLMPLAAHMTPEVLSDRITAIMDKHVAELIGINLILAPFSIGLLMGAAAFAYKQLSARPAGEQY